MSKQNIILNINFNSNIEESFKSIHNTLNDLQKQFHTFSRQLDSIGKINWFDGILALLTGISAFKPIKNFVKTSIYPLANSLKQIRPVQGTLAAVNTSIRGLGAATSSIAAPLGAFLGEKGLAGLIAFGGMKLAEGISNTALAIGGLEKRVDVEAVLGNITQGLSEATPKILSGIGKLGGNMVTYLGDVINGRPISIYNKGKEAADTLKQGYEDTTAQIDTKLPPVQGPDTTSAKQNLENFRTSAHIVDETLAGLQENEIGVTTSGMEEAKQDSDEIKRTLEGLEKDKPAIEPEINTEKLDEAGATVKAIDEATPDVEVTATTSEPDQAEKDLDGAEWTASLKIEVDDSAADAFAKEWSGKVTRSKHIIQVVEERAAGGLIGDFKRLVSPLINQGGGQRDDVPAMLMRGEFVMKRDAVNKYGLGLMHAINQGMLPQSIIPRFAAGGVVGNGRALDQAIKRAISGLRGVKPFQHKPAAFLKDPFSAFKKGIAELKATGAVSGAQAELGQQQALITETYQTQITEARAAGLDEIAFALEEQKLALETLMADLRAMLDQIKAAYEIGMQEAEVGRQQALADARAAYDELLPLAA